MHALDLALGLIAETANATTETGGAGFWAGVGLASLIATAVATGVSTVAAIWWRVHDRAEADWVFLQPSASWTPATKWHAVLDCELANAGDGSAFQVEISSSQGTVSIQGAVSTSRLGGSSRQDLGTRVPLLRPGDAVHVEVKVLGNVWDDAAVDVTWTPAPTRRGKRVTTRVPVREIAERPTYGERSPDADGNVRFFPLPEPLDPLPAATPTAPPPRTKAVLLRRLSLRRRRP